MLYVALAEAIALVALVAVFGNTLRIVVRQSARERERLIDQVCHLSGKPWNEAPATELVVEPEDERYLVALPEQLPDW